MLPPMSNPTAVDISSNKENIPTKNVTNEGVDTTAMRDKAISSNRTACITKPTIANADQSTLPRATLQLLSNYQSVLPDALVLHIMRRSGISDPTNASIRCLGVAAQKFITDVVNDAFVLTELREEARGGILNRDYVLTEDIVKEVLNHRGIFVDSFH